MNVLPLMVPDWPLPTGVRAAQTTRSGGFSAGPWSSLNLALHTGDDPQIVRRNRLHLIGALGLQAELLWPRQVHGADVARAEALREDTEADAVVAFTAGAVCCVQTADCLPVLLASTDGSRVAAAHAGWRGLVAGVLEATVEAMDHPPERLTVWLGPAIGAGAFEVGPEVRAAFLARDPLASRAFRAGIGDRWFADVYGLARQALRRAGVREIHGGGRCTYTESETFFSYRRDGVCGRMGTLIWRLPDA